MSAPLDLEIRWVVAPDATGTPLTASVTLHESSLGTWSPRGLDSGRLAHLALCAAALLGVRTDDLEFVDGTGAGRTYRSTVAAHVGWTRVVAP